MNIIDKDNARYAEVVDIYDKTKYHINPKYLSEEEAVVCPFDSDMLIVKRNDKVIVVKKAYRNPNV